MLFDIFKSRLKLPRYVFAQKKSCMQISQSFWPDIPEHFKPTTHAIFDVDGLLLNTEHIYWKSFEEIAERYGKKYTNELRVKHLGCPSDIGCQIVIDALNLPLPLEQFLIEYHDIANRRIQECSLMPGVEMLLYHLHRHKVPLAIATSSAEPGWSLKVSKHRSLFDLFHHHVVIGNEPHITGKPAPDLFLLAAQRFPDNPPPEKCLAFEDSPNGLVAAASAGMQCVLVPDETIHPDYMKLATCVIRSLVEFRPEWFGLPPYE